MLSHFDFLKKSILFLYIILILIILCQTANAQSEEEMNILIMFYKENELVITPTRYPKPISQVAENISIITAEEIELMNAHTLKDILNYIPGVQIDMRGGPGSSSNVQIHGSYYTHVLVMIDGVTQNNLTENASDIGSIPIQNIEKIEIIKGPASSSWGSSLGGIINIITKPVGESQKIKGILSESSGERNTMDHRFEVYGRMKKLGYYLYAGNLDSDGLTLNTHTDESNFYAKLKHDLTDKTNFLFTFGFNNGSRGDGEISEVDWSGHTEFDYLFSTLTFNHSLNSKADIKLSFRKSKNNLDILTKILSKKMELKSSSRDSTYGGSVEVTWKQGIHNIVFGSDFDAGKLKSENITDGRQDLDKWAIFANDTVAFKRFSFTPGIRYDYTSTNNDFLSPSLGITYGVTEKTVFRAYVARGFNIPPLAATFGDNLSNSIPNPDLKVEKVWSMHLGFETTAPKYLWFKTTLFRHNIRDAIDREPWPIDPNNYTIVNKNKQRRQGVEIEIKSVPIYNASLFAGFTLIDAKDMDTGDRLTEIARYTYDIGIQYNIKSFKAYFKGHYIYWYPDPCVGYRSKFHIFIWDLNLIRDFLLMNKITLNAFINIHNIFNGTQYLNESFRNPRRWFEVGVRFKF